MPVYSTVCPRNCYSACSFKVHVKKGKIVRIAPHAENKTTPEGICLRGLSYLERVYSPQRILFPLKKISNDKFKRISWSEALSAISEKMLFLRQRYGAQSIFFYEAGGMLGLLSFFSLKFWEMFGGCTTTYGDLYCSAGIEATRLTLGKNKHSSPWTLEDAKLIILWGKNPAETNVHEMIPIAKAQQKDAKLVVIDPRRTQSSERADLLIQIRPGTDAALALAIANILIKKEWIDKDFIANFVHGYEFFKESVEDFSVNEAESITGVPANYIYRLAHYIGNTKPMTIIAGFGIQQYSNGGQTIRALLSLNILTGNIGIRGGGWHYANLQSQVFNDFISAIYPENTDKIKRRIPVANIGKAMLRADNPSLKMAWIERANPVTQHPDTNQTLKALHKIPFKVVVEQFMTDTAREADIILPAKTMFEQSDLVASFWSPYLQLRQKVIDPPGEVKPETEIYYLLAKALGYTEDEMSETLLPPGDKYVIMFLKKMLQRFPEIKWSDLEKRPVIPPEVEEIAFSNLQFPTPSKKIELFSKISTSQWGVSPVPDFKWPKELKELLKLKDNNKYLHLITPGSKNHGHSHFNNLKSISQFSPKPLIYIHPDDAKARNIKDADRVKVFNSRGSIKLKAELSYDILPGCVYIFKGWWNNHGANANFLSGGRETDMGHGTAFHDNVVQIEKN